MELECQPTTPHSFSLRPQKDKGGVWKGCLCCGFERVQQMSGLPVEGLLVMGLQQRPSHPTVSKKQHVAESRLGFSLVIEGEDNSRV